MTAVLEHIDSLLQASEATATADSPFSKIRPDLGEAEIRALRAAVGWARRRLFAALRGLGLERPAASVSARWSVQTNLRFIEIALADLDEETLAGYGSVSAEIAERVSAAADELRTVIGRIVALLQENDEEWRERLATAPDPAAGIVQQLGRIIADAELVQLRAPLAALAERAGAAALQVGVFGRVGAGKSSLVNAIAGTDVLPVGAVPVTAVPLRLEHGEAEALRVVAADGRESAVPVSELAAYATEAENPDNVRGVRSLRIFLPTIPPGLALLDTPGVGSLSTSGSAQAFAWLPRCDLGLVLVAAGSAISPDDLALVAGLTHAGVPCHVLVSKADLLAGGQIGQVRAYLEREVGQVMASVPDTTVPLEFVSTVSGQGSDVATFVAEVIAPMLRDRAGTRRRLIARRLRQLIEAVDAELTAGALPEADAASEGDHAPEAGPPRREVQREIRLITDELARADGPALAEANEAAMAAWRRGEAARSDVRAALRAPADRALERIRRLAGGGEAVIPPFFDPAILGSVPALAPPGGLARIAARTKLRRELDRLRPDLATALSRYAARLEAWGRARLGSGMVAVAAVPHRPVRRPELLALLQLVDDAFGLAPSAALPAS